ncbi:hypothetical protein G9A89_021797 [Geosiphon pyriformis]|nr:hypothetical protein G9A89_021797 [Geosiphon pyriformis]
MAYVPIAKIEKFSGKEDDAQTWISDVPKAITTNNWNDAKTDTTELKIVNEDVQPNNLETNQQPTITSNISPATIMEDESLAAIFFFKIKEPTEIFLFSGAAFEEKLITAMYMDGKIDGHSIKLILDSRSADSIITRQLMDQLGCRVNQAASTKIITTNGATKTPIGEIDDLSIEVNSIIISIKVLVMEAIQYQALVNNNWLFKINKMLDWNTQEL